jgi:hypothetical protein
MQSVACSGDLRRLLTLRRITKRSLWGLALLFAFVLIWRKVRIVVFVPLTFGQMVLLFLGLALAIYLVFEILLGRSGRD